MDPKKEQLCSTISYHQVKYCNLFLLLGLRNRANSLSQNEKEQSRNNRVPVHIKKVPTQKKKKTPTPKK